MRRWALVLLVSLLVGLIPGLGSAAETQRNQGSSTVRYGLELDGVFAGWVDSVEGGQASGDVVLEKLGPDHVAKKHIGNVKYEDITVTCGTGMSKAFYNWVQASFDRKYARKSGAIIAADYNYNEIARVEFTGAMVTEVGFPALDAASKDAAKMTLKFSPEVVSRAKGRGRQLPGLNSRDQKQWLPSNFRLRIDGLDVTTARVSKIEAFVAKQKVVENPVGQLRDYEQEPASMEIPNLVIGWSEPLVQNPLFRAGTTSGRNPIYEWYDDFVIKGNNSDDKERNGTLEYLDADGKPLFTLTFGHLGIFKVAPDKAEAGGEGIGRVKAEMYCESITFSYAQ